MLHSTRSLPPTYRSTFSMTAAISPMSNVRTRSAQEVFDRGNEAAAAECRWPVTEPFRHAFARYVVECRRRFHGEDKLERRQEQLRGQFDGDKLNAEILDTLISSRPAGIANAKQLQRLGARPLEWSIDGSRILAVAAVDGFRTPGRHRRRSAPDGPILSMLQASAMPPVELSAAKGRPQPAGAHGVHGDRMLPCVSLPSAKLTSPAATAEALPAEEPLDPCFTFHGFRVFRPNHSSLRASEPSDTLAVRQRNGQDRQCRLHDCSV